MGLRSILIYTHEFPPFKGGAGVYSHDLAVGLISLGVEVHVLTPQPSVETGSTDLKDIHIHFLARTSTRISTQHALCCLQLKYRFDVILVTERRAQEKFARMSKGLFSYATVLHGSEILIYFRDHATKLPVLRDRMIAYYKEAIGCIAVSKATAALTRRVFPGQLRCTVVPNGIDTSRLLDADPDDVKSLRQSRPPDSRIIFCLARLDLDKGHDILIRAFALVRHVYTRAYLVIGGMGPYRAALEELCVELQLESCVDFVGEVPSSMLPAYFTLCDVFALTSKCERRWEGFGLVYLEAGYYGKPVIGGHEGGVPEAIAHLESGLLVNPRDSEAVAIGIIALLSDRDMAMEMGARGRQRVLSYFNARRMAKDTLEYLETKVRIHENVGRFVNIKLWACRYLCALILFVKGLPRLSDKV